MGQKRVELGFQELNSLKTSPSELLGGEITGSKT
jgi:hypothetical protein